MNKGYEIGEQLVSLENQRDGEEVFIKMLMILKDLRPVDRIKVLKAICVYYDVPVFKVSH